MKKAVITTGGKQYLVSEGQTLDVELVGGDKKLSFEPLLLIDGEQVQVGTPALTANTVTAEVIESKILADKVMAIRYKAKKRVRKVRGHRQRLSRIKVVSIK